MKRFIVIILFCLIGLQYQLQANNNKQQEDEYYWFYIQLGKTSDRETGTNRIFVRNIGNEIESGSYDQFTRSHDDGLKSGRIVLGPFSEYTQAQKSQLLYKYAGRGSNVPAKELVSPEDDSIYAFFYTKPFSEDFVQNINFERIPSRVINGDLNDFMELLQEGLQFDKLAIGPFDNYELAEKSKFVFMRNGEFGAEESTDSIKNNDLITMSKKWKSLNLEILKQQDNEPNKYTYRFNTKFPRKYFVSDAVQIITIKANYSDTFHDSSTSFTLQGEDVSDNNPVISSEMGTVYISVLHFDKLKTSKIDGFLFESFIYNNSEMIDLDPIFIPVK